MNNSPEPGLKASINKAQADPPVDLVIVGAGFAGLYMLHRARSLGLRAIV